MFAIVAMDCVLPGAPDAEAWGRLDRPALAPIPAGRWPMDPASVHDPAPGACDAVAAVRGGFVDDRDAVALTRHVVGNVLGEARAERTALILANLGLPSTGLVRANGGRARRLLAAQGRAHPWLVDADPSARAHQALPARAAAEAYGLADWVTLDAACASGLYAVTLACDRLAAHEVDAVVAAGVQRSDAAYLFLGFSQLRALSPTGTPRPLDRRADGLAVGEGAAAVLIMRLDDALRDGRRVLAVLRGGALGNDGRKGNMLAPNGAGQLRTLRAAWASAGISPATLGYVECHATGTPLGDRVEIEALERLLREAGHDGPPVAVASAKALIGHTITVAGLAGLIRAVHALDGMRPAGATEPMDALRGSPHLATFAERTSWPEGPRRAAVSAFGFGGTDAHVILERFPPARPAPARPVRPREALVLVGVSARVGGLEHQDALDAIRAGRVGEAGIPFVEVDPRRWKIPPLELTELSPQQVLALEVAGDALEGIAFEPDRTGVIFGMEVDPRVGDAVLRAAVRSLDPAIADTIAPPLTPGRVQGQLPNFIANRLCAQLDLRGPSYVVSAGGRSLRVALDHAARLIADEVVDVVVAGVVDLPRHPALTARPAEGAVALVVTRRRTAEARRWTVLAAAPSEDAPEGGLIEGAMALLATLPAIRLPARKAWNRAIRVCHPPEPGPAETGWIGDWGGDDAVPCPTPGSTPSEVARFEGPDGALMPLSWPLRPLSGPQSFPPAPSPTAPPSPPGRAHGPLLAQEVAGLTALAVDAGRVAERAASVHGRFLAQQRQSLEALAAWVVALERAGEPHGRIGTFPGTASAAASSGVAPPRPPSPPAAPLPPRSDHAPVTLDRAALEAHASGTLSEAFGPGWADLDAHAPRVRMPSGELLLCSRVVALEGERGVFGPSRIVTEYDIPVGHTWTTDGRPPACVVVESGQADLLLVSYLGVDARCRGARVYRLLDCDLTFHGPRPDAGETLRHDIRIDRFAKLGGTTLFYFHYDCVAAADGRPVLSMRNGCAGFFTPQELAKPKGLDLRPPKLPEQAPLTPIVSGAPSSLDDLATGHLRAGRASHAFGPAFAAADGARLGLADSKWCLVHRVSSLSFRGGAHGLGEVVYAQDLRDDDWFNAIHFEGDPCMPGTLMYDGCLQAVQLWLLGLGVATRWPDASFEPMPGRAARLRCRGQVVPGHSTLVYRARIREAGLLPAPWAVADVILEVDGVAVVIAHEVGVVVVGAARAVPAAVDAARVLEYSIGSAERAFGAAYRPYDTPGRRCARMPGPPYLTMTRITGVEGEPRVEAAPRSVVVEWEVAPDAWYFRADPQGAVPFAVLLEASLQPCGWLTAWQGQAIASKEDRFFRNLGGQAVMLAEVPPGTVLRTRATQTTIASSGGMTVVFYRTDVYACHPEGQRHVFGCDTHFGYFTAAALSAQKGLLPSAEEEARRAVGRAARVERAPLGAPRDDWRMIDRIVAADPTGGPHGLGFYAAETDVDPEDWYFTAHFHQDPVMPGSLGLEALLQLARHVGFERGWTGRIRPLRLDHEVRWTYRGQVLRQVRVMGLELEVREVNGRMIRADGLVRADGLPIYRFEDLALEVSEEPVAALFPVGRPPRAPGPAALLDAFSVDGDQGHGYLRLDPATHPWLADHCPTVATPALPMAFAAEIAAEAASLLRPGLRVVGLPELEAERWIHTGDGPVDLQIVAVGDGDLVAVSLAVHAVNPRFPHLSGPRVHMRALVRMGQDWAPEEAPQDVDVPPADIDVRAYYDGGHTFHGPTLQGMVALTHLGPRGARAVFRTRPDAELLGGAGAFVLDPLLLDTATHPMWSAEPERWVPGLAPGHLAYPVRAEEIRFFGPRPHGDVNASLRLVSADTRHLTFEVHLVGWCAYRWREAIVSAGPLLGQPAPVRRQFLWDRAPVPEVRVGRADEDTWVLEAADLIEPLPGTLAALTCTEAELRERQQAPDPVAWDLAWLAAKEALRSWLMARMGRDVHPRDLVLCRMRSDRFVVVEAPTLTATEYVDHLGPTRFAIEVTGDGTRATSRIRAL